MITVDYDSRKMHTPIRVLILDAKGGTKAKPKRVSVRFTEGANLIDPSVWEPIALREDVQGLIASGAIVVRGAVPSPPAAISEGGSLSRDDREVELAAMNNQMLALAARKYKIGKPESGDWLEVIPQILALEFGGEAA